MDRGARGGKKSKGGPSPPTYASAVKGWAAQGAVRDGQQPSTFSPGRRSRTPDLGASLQRSPRWDTGRGGSQSTSRPTSKDQRDPSADLDTASTRRGRSPVTQGVGSKGALLGIGRGRSVMPPPVNPPKASTIPSSKGWAGWVEDRSQPIETGSNESCSDSASEQTGPRLYGGHLPGEGPVPRGVDTVVLLSGEQVYRGTPAQSILVYEHCRAENLRNNLKFQLWCSEQVENKPERMQDRMPLNTIAMPQIQQLPHLPDWAAPNRWDFWGRPWAYMDAPFGNSAVGVKSKEGKARVTITVLVRLDPEEQYLPDQNVAKSAGAAGTLARKSRVFHDDETIREDKKRKITPYAVTRTLYPRGWGLDRCAAVHALLKCWHSFRTNRVGQRLNPPMPVDVTPEGCDRPAPPQNSEPPAVWRRPRGPANTFGPSTDSRCVKTAAVQATELAAKTRTATPTIPVRRQTPVACAATLKEALEAVQR